MSAYVADVPVGWAATQITINGRTFRCIVGGVAAGSPHNSDFDAAATPGVSTVTDGTITWLFLGAIPTTVPWGFIDDPNVALVPQSVTKWPNGNTKSYTLGATKSVTTPDNSANQTLDDGATFNAQSFAVPDDSTVTIDWLVVGHTDTDSITFKFTTTWRRAGGGSLSRVADDMPTLGSAGFHATSGLDGSTFTASTGAAHTVQLQVTPEPNANVYWTVVRQQYVRIK